FGRRVEEIFDVGKSDNLVELARNFLLVHPENRAVQINVLAAGQIGMKSSADAEQASGAAKQIRKPGGRPRNPRQNSQQRRFTGAVASDDADDFAGLHFETDVAQRPDVRIGAVAAANEPRRGLHRVFQRFAQSWRDRFTSPEVIFLPQAFCLDDWPHAKYLRTRL